MTVPATMPRNGPYVGDDITTEFDYTFLAWAAEDLRVIRRTVATADEVDLILDTDYTVTGVGNESGGTVLLLGGPLIKGSSLTILSRVVLKQEMDLVNNNAYDAEVIERAFDRQCRISQQLSEELNRCVKVPPGDTTDPQVYLAVDIDLAVTTAQSHAAAAEDYKDSASVSAVNAAASEENAAESEAMAQEWAENPEDIEITDNPGSYSAKHWASKAASFVGGSGPRYFNEEIIEPSTDPNQGAIYVGDVGGLTELKIRGESDQTPLVITRDGMTGLNVQVADIPAHTHDGTDLTDLEGHLGGTGFSELIARSDHYHPLALFCDYKNTGTNGGATTAGIWHTRDLNTEIFDEIGISVVSNRLVLPGPGFYELTGYTVAYGCNFAWARFFNYSNGVYLNDCCPHIKAAGSDSGQYMMMIVDRLNITGITLIEIRMYATGTHATGLGYASNAGYENYSAVLVKKLN